MQREKKTLQIYGAEKYTSARHACRMRKGFLYIIECHRHKTKSWGYGEQPHPADGQYTGWKEGVQVLNLVGHHDAEREEWTLDLQ